MHKAKPPKQPTRTCHGSLAVRRHDDAEDGVPVCASGGLRHVHRTQATRVAAVGGHRAHRRQRRLDADVPEGAHLVYLQRWRLVASLTQASTTPTGNTDNTYKRHQRQRVVVNDEGAQSGAAAHTFGSAAPVLQAPTRAEHRHRPHPRF